MNLSKLNVQELNTAELRNIEGGFPPVVLATWAAMVAIDCALVKIYADQQQKK